jgi:HAE1 family hydrophobic/amphiphilic exporter-1
MRRLVEIATERRVTIVMFMVAIVLFGMVSLSRLKLNLLPDISYPTVTVRTELTGAAPVEIENLLTKPIEEAVGVPVGNRHGYCWHRCSRKARCTFPAT